MLMEDAPLSFVTTELETHSPVPPHKAEEPERQALRKRCLSLWQQPGACEERLRAIGAALGLPDAPLTPQTMREETCTLLRRFCAVSLSLREVGGAALSRFAGEDGAARIAAAEARLTSLLPAWERYYANILANHMFFVRFPYADSALSLSDAFVSLRAACGIVRLCILAAAPDASDSADAAVRFADAAAAALRYIEHTDFPHNAPLVLRHAQNGAQRKD